MGHKNVVRTQLHIQLEKAIFDDFSDEFACKAAKNAEEAKALIEVGFNSVCTMPEDMMLFRKRK